MKLFVAYIGLFAIFAGGSHAEDTVGSATYSDDGEDSADAAVLACLCGPVLILSVSKKKMEEAPKVWHK